MQTAKPVLQQEWVKLFGEALRALYDRCDIWKYMSNTRIYNLGMVILYKDWVIRSQVSKVYSIIGVSYEKGSTTVRLATQVEYTV